jgi:hypothetical protein
MIKNILSRGNLVTTYIGSAPYISPGAQGAGMVRYNTNTQNMEVYDGVVWKELSTNIEMGLSAEAEATIVWARKKMLEEARIDELCKKYPGLDKARANYEAFLAMVESETSI